MAFISVVLNNLNVKIKLYVPVQGENTNKKTFFMWKWIIYLIYYNNIMNLHQTV